jgi:DNA uptake protein ComE-like DNA-binding protein
VARELEGAEQQLAAEQGRTEHAIEQARIRLAEIEARAVEAEARAVRAERLAELKSKETDRERRLREMMDRIDEAEKRARVAEARARSAVEQLERATPPSAAAPAVEQPPTPGAQLNLNTASFEQLRELGMSVTQTGRVLAYRERHGFRSVDELSAIPGFPDGFLEGIRTRLTV